MLLKPEEVSKKPKKNKVLEVLGIGVVRILVFWYLLRFWQGFQKNIAKT